MGDENKVANRDRKKFGWYLKWFLFLVVLYFLLPGPYSMLERKTHIHPTVSTYVHKAFYPLDFLCSKSAHFKKGFDWYNGLWAPSSPQADAEKK